MDVVQNRILKGLLIMVLLQSGLAQTAVDFTRDIEPILHQNCYLCHGSVQQMAGLRLDNREMALQGSDSGAVIVPEDPQASKLIARVTSEQAGFRMPPGKEAALQDTDISKLRTWIATGAHWPVKQAEQNTQSSRSEQDGTVHWAFQPVRYPPLPDVKRTEWVRNPVDLFVLSRLESMELEPSPQAAPSTLLRRVYLDLTGLPPSPRMLDKYLGQDSPQAYEELLDTLLQSDHFGERWALPWLDLARYADSEGYERDPLRPHAWRWRHWLIQAINNDMPYDRFSIEQIAGDLLPHATTEQRVATGFLRNGIKNREAGVENAQKRFEETVDRVNTVANAWLGLTVGCAQCHDHKYDPISQREFYGMFAYFHNAVEQDIEALMPGELGSYLRSVTTYRSARNKLLAESGIPALLSDWRQQMLQTMDFPGVRTDWDHEVTEWRAANDRADWLLRSHPGQLTQLEREKITNWFLRSSGPDFNKDEAVKSRLEKLRKELAELNSQVPVVTQAYTMVERHQPLAARIALRGNHRELGSEVPPHTPAVLPDLEQVDKPPRLLLAEWIASETNPLTARVEVNRIWQELFGMGLVETSENFGTQGSAPSHPELLDWLASEFVRSGWSRKKMVRLIMTSATYRQASDGREMLLSQDAGNILLARQNRLRLSAELIRDNALAVSGLLNPAVGGRSVFPPQPPGVSDLSYAKKDWAEDLDAQRYRRGLYVFFRRTSPYPMLVNFDAPTSLVGVSRRERSNTPLQALNLLNDPVFLEAAEALSYRVRSSGLVDFEERYEYLVKLCLAREAVEQETVLAKRFFQAQLERNEGNPGGAKQAAWLEMGRAMLSLDEFITRE